MTITVNFSFFNKKVQKISEIKDSDGNKKTELLVNFIGDNTQ